ncbi:MAG: hypothetical protein KAY27_04070, partial [Pedobacter sp.]|nr:hypothetical protein [Pedobacter sp.]
MLKKIKLLAGFAMLFISVAATLKSDTLESLLSDLKALAEASPQEKAHLHLDKPYYTAGDHIWFKAYVLDEHSLNPSALSSVLYV